MTDWLPSLNALRAFEAVSRHLSYRRAADELHVTPAAVKQLVRKLEEALGTPLVRRSGRGIALTGAGVAGLSDLNSAFKLITGAVEKMRAVERRQSLTISVEASFAAAWLVPKLAAFKMKYPEVDVLIDSSMRVVDLEREGIDIGIRYGAKHGKDHIVHRLFEDETMAVCSPGLAKGPPALESIKDLEKATLLHLDPSFLQSMPATRHWFDWQTWLDTVGAGDVKLGPGLRFNDYNLAVQAAIAGQGVVLGSWLIVKDAIEANLLVSPFAERAHTDASYDLATTKEAMAKPAVASFVEWILEETDAEPSAT
jgi:LysR family glycine cleavage system transcriptional activator